MTQPATAQNTTVVRHVHATIECVLRTPARLILQVAVADGPPRLSESLSITLNGKPCQVTEIGLAAGGRAHVVLAQPGTLAVDYQASVGPGTGYRPVTETDRLIYSRPSRYSESDRLFPMAVSELPSVVDTDELTVMNAVATFVSGRTAYIVGSSRVTDGAVDTLLASAGVCRDFVHLSVGLMRALGCRHGQPPSTRPASSRWTSRRHRGRGRRPLAHHRHHRARAAADARPHRHRPRRGRQRLPRRPLRPARRDPPGGHRAGRPDPAVRRHGGTGPAGVSSAC